MTIVRVQTGDPQVAKSCFGGCLLLIGWLVVGVVNVIIMVRSQLASWQETLVGIVWLLSLPVGSVAYLRWRGKRHSKAFSILEGKMVEKMRERLRKEPPEPGAGERDAAGMRRPPPDLP